MSTDEPDWELADEDHSSVKCWDCGAPVYRRNHLCDDCLIIIDTCDDRWDGLGR